MTTISRCGSSSAPSSRSQTASNGSVPRSAAIDGQVAARELGPERVVEQHHAAPVATRAEDAAVAAHRVAARRVAEQGRELVPWDGERLAGQRREEVREAERARVHVERDVEPGVVRRVDDLDAAIRLLGPAARHEVRDLEAGLRVRRPCGPPRRPASAAPSSRRRVCVAYHAPSAAATAASSVTSSSVAPVSGRVLEPGGVPPGALGERLAQELRHRAALGGRRRTVGEPDRGEPQLAVRDEAEDVDRRPCGLEAVEVLPRARPRQRHRVVVAVDRRPREAHVAHREAPVPAVADHLGASRPGGWRSPPGGRRAACSPSGCGCRRTPARRPGRPRRRRRSPRRERLRRRSRDRPSARRRRREAAGRCRRARCRRG